MNLEKGKTMGHRGTIWVEDVVFLSMGIYGFIELELHKGYIMDFSGAQYIPDAPWCWNIYLQNWAVCLGYFCRLKYSSTMVSLSGHG